MSNINYEGTINGYSFLMNNPKTIEVWVNSGGDFPDFYINVREGSIKNQKDFEKEISFWFMDNVQG